MADVPIDVGIYEFAWRRMDDWIWSFRETYLHYDAEGRNLRGSVQIAETLCCTLL